MNMLELSEERRRNDELELEYYGFSSTQLYLNYRESTNQKLKLLMLELLGFYIEKEKQDREVVRQMLIVQYCAFWGAAERTFQTFYEEIQNALALPKNFVPKGSMRVEDFLDDLDVTKIEKEINDLEEQFLSEKLYLNALAQRKDLIENKCIPLKNQIGLTAKLLKDNITKMAPFEVLDGKRVNGVQKFMEGFDKKTVVERMARGTNEANEKETMKHYMEIIKKNEKN